MNSRITTGLTLIVLGGALLAKYYYDIHFGPLGWAILGAIGVGVYFMTRNYGLLIAGSILMGYGVGSFGDGRWMGMNEFAHIGLGVGFILIFVIQMLVERRAHWWPLIPGTVLVLLGFQSWGRFWRFLFSDEGWPLILMIVGGLILLGGLRQRTAERKRKKS